MRRRWCFRQLRPFGKLPRGQGIRFVTRCVGSAHPWRPMSSSPYLCPFNLRLTIKVAAPSDILHANIMTEDAQDLVFVCSRSLVHEKRDTCPGRARKFGQDA